jgi:hypothetical protein
MALGLALRMDQLAHARHRGTAMPGTAGTAAVPAIAAAPAMASRRFIFLFMCDIFRESALKVGRWP